MWKYGNVAIVTIRILLPGIIVIMVPGRLLRSTALMCRLTSQTSIKDWISRKLNQGKSSIAPALNAQTLNLLQQTAQYFNNQRQQAYLVGGSLRNILLGQPGNDWDIVTSGDAPSLARRLADKLGGHYVYMHQKAHRVVVPPSEDRESTQASKEFIIDIAQLKGNTLE